MMKKHSVILFGHATSFSLEEEFWQEFKTIAKQKQISLARLLEQLDSSREENLSSAIRLFILRELKKNQ